MTARLVSGILSGRSFPPSPALHFRKSPKSQAGVTFTAQRRVPASNEIRHPWEPICLSYVNSVQGRTSLLVTGLGVEIDVFWARSRCGGYVNLSVLSVVTPPTMR